MTGSQRDHLLAIDVGTQSVRALLFDPAGALVGQGRVAIEPYVSPHPGWAEQDPEVWWSAIGEACRMLWAATAGAEPRGPGPETVAGVGLTTQRVTLVVSDAEGRPLRPAIVWLDQRRTEGLRPVGGMWGLAFKATRTTETVSRFQADCEANWIERHEPEVWRGIRRYGVLSSWLTARLVGEWVDSAAAQVGYLPFDFKRSRWSGRFDWKWRVAAFRREWLPRLVPPTQPLGQLTAAGCEHLGLPPGASVPLIAAAGDKQCEALGAGALQPELAALSFGTTATIGTIHRRYLEAIPLVPPYPAALPGAWFVEMQVMRGFWMVEWFKHEFGSAEVARGAALDIPPEALFEELLTASPPGSMGLMLQPYWMPGVRYPGPEAKGAIVGFGEAHGRAHVYRAILEGLAYALREAADRITRRAKVPLAELRVSGGGAQSRAAVQLFADVFGLPASRPHTHEAAGLGAAIGIALGVGLHPDAATAVRAMVHISERFEPDPAAMRLYDDLYRSVYLPMYDRLRPLYREVRRITNYPPA
ncbi:MAG: carbohydrate kinase [Chloroflexi bacterium]|nr:carbohydrate kinase [Chloroflexota bacterium]